MLDELNVTYLVLICKQEFCNYLFCKYAQTYNGCNEGAIGYDDLDGFSEELREDVIRITSYNAHESE